MIDVYPRYAELLARRGGSLPTPADRRAAVPALQRRRPARPAGLAQARLDRSALSRRRRARPGAGREGARLLRGRQGSCCERGARAAERGHSRVPGRGGARADRDVGVAVLPPDSAAAVRHRHLPAHASRFARCRGSGSCTPRMRSSSSSGPLAYHERLFGRRPVGLWPSEGSVSDAMVPLVAARRLRVDGHRRADPGADARTRRSRATATDTSSSPSGSTRRTRSAPAARAVACAFRDHVLSDLIGFTYAGWARRRGGRRLRRRVWPKRAGGIASAPAGERRSSRSSSTARTPGSTSRAAAGRSCARSTGGCPSHPELRTVTMAEACAGAPATSSRESFPGPGSTRTSTSGSVTPTTSGPGVSWPTRGRRWTGPRTWTPPPSSRGARGDPDRRRQRLVLVVRRRPLVGARPRVRRPVPPASAERLPAAPEAGARRALRQQHLDGERPSALRPSRRRS